MSHYSKTETKMNSLEILKKTATDLGYSFKEGGSLAGDYTDRWEAGDRSADIVLNIDGRKDIGFKKDEHGLYNVVGDFYRFKMTQVAFVDQFLQKYNYNFVMDKIENSTSYGITDHSTEQLANGDIVWEAEIDQDQIVTA